MLRTFSAVLLVFWTLSCQQSQQHVEPPPPSEPEVQFHIDGTLDIMRAGQTLRTLEIEIADTDDKRERGMMERTAFPPDTGMLFLMEQERVQQFWMGNTPLSLDLIFIDADSQIVDISREAMPYSPEAIVSRVPALYVLEVPAGFADSQGLVEGDRVRWSRH